MKDKINVVCWKDDFIHLFLCSYWIDAKNNTSLKLKKSFRCKITVEIMHGNINQLTIICFLKYKYVQ